MQPSVHWPLLLLGSAGIFLWLGVLLGRTLVRYTQQRTGRMSNERGQRGEVQAEKLLRSLGYRIQARRVAGSYSLEVDGSQESVQLIADLVVERNGRRLVAEVKTGRQAPRLGHADTRRQMLEYQLAFAVPGILLVDADSGSVREIRFPLSPRHRSGGSTRILLLLALSLAIGALVVTALVRAPR